MPTFQTPNMIAKKQAKAKAVAVPPIEGTKRNRGLTSQAEGNYKEYGTYTIENRALPDVRDGLKPVHRRILYAMAIAKLFPNNKQVKAAKIVGHVMGNFHPHGDKPIFDALAKMAGTKKKGSKKSDPWLTANQPEPNVQGFGNWGDHQAEAGAMRYVECRLSDYSAMFMLDPEYLKVMDYVPNFDDTDVEPVILPAKIPNVLVNGASGVAVGVTGGIPAFTKDSVGKCAIMAMKGTLTDKDLFINLKPHFAYGGYITKTSLKEIIKNQTTSVPVFPEFEYDGSVCKVTSTAPMLPIANMAQKMTETEGTASVKDETGTHISLVAYPTKMSDVARQKWADAIKAKLKGRTPIRLNATVREADGTVKFIETNILDIFTRWAEWRIEIERKVIANRIEANQRQIDLAELLIIGVNGIQIIIASLKVEDSEAYLVKKLNVTAEQAKYLLDQPIRRFKTLEVTKLTADIKTRRIKDRDMKAQKKSPQSGIIEDLNTLLQP